MSGYEPSVHQEHSGQQGESPDLQNDNKLLSFSLPNIPFALFNFASQRVTITMAAQLHGMFFLAESPWVATDTPTATPELTCYRRNLFQISGTVTMPRGLQTIMNEQGEALPTMPGVPLELTISATESLEGNAVKIISVPWKTPPTSTAPPAPEDKTEKEPQSYPLDLTQGQDLDAEYVNFPIIWKRLQFRIATANNGRRKELQQHFVVRLRVMAPLVNGAKVCICEIRSGPIIVRGRSPRNFHNRRDVAISGSTASQRRTNIPAQPSRTPTGDVTQTTPGANAHKNASNNMSSMNQQTPDMMQMPFDFSSNDYPRSPFSDWKMPGAMTAIPETPDTHNQNLAQYPQSTPEIARTTQPSQPYYAPAPVSLSLTDDEPKNETPPTEPLRKRITPARAPSSNLTLGNSPDEGADKIYEYFPISVTDWDQPVDAVYRPHVVHHTNVPSDAKVLESKSKSKRYFSEVWS